MIQDILDHLNKENIKYKIARYNKDVMKNDMISIGSGEKSIEIIMRPEDLLKIKKARLMQLN